VVHLVKGDSMFAMFIGACIGYVISFPIAWLINRYAPKSWIND